MTTAKKKPMKSLCNLDDVDWICPCGATITTSGDQDSLDRFIDAHFDHTDGTYLDICTDDGARAWSSKPEPVCRPLRPNREEKK